MRQVIVGVDVGGTRTKTMAVPVTMRDGMPLLLPGSATRSVHPTPADVAADPVAHLMASVAGVLAPGEEPLAVGAVVPGLVEDATGTAVWSGNLGWRDVPLLPLLREAVLRAHPSGPAVAVGHDVRAGLVGEHAFGAARGATDALFVPLGTGVAAALLSGGRLVSGSPWTGEIGHVVVDPAGPACGCGGRGCLEALIGAASLNRRWRAAGGGDGGVRSLVAGVRRGDPRARALWTPALAALAGVLAPLAAATGAVRVILGGGLAESGHVLLDPVRERLDAILPGRSVEVVPAELGDQAAALGAAVLAARVLRPDRPVLAGVGEEAP